MATRDPHSHTDTAQGEITDANLRLNVDFEQRLLEGDVTLTLANAKAGPFDLDTRGLEISRVADAEGNDLDWQLGEHAGLLGWIRCPQMMSLKTAPRQGPSSESPAMLDCCTMPRLSKRRRATNREAQPAPEGG